MPRYKPLFGTIVRTPLFEVEVPVLAHHLAEPEKGTGIAMICTFGDVTDVTWWRELNLPSRALIGFDGRMAIDTPDWIRTPAGQAAYGHVAGLAPKQAQRKIVELLAESGEMLGEPRSISHPVKFYERGTRPLEIVATRQWYIRNGGRDETLRNELLERGAELIWHPAVHAQPLSELGRRSQWRLARQPAALLRRPDSRCGTGSTTRATRCTTRCSCPPTRSCRSTPRSIALPVSPTTNAANRMGSVAIPT